MQHPGQRPRRDAGAGRVVRRRRRPAGHDPPPAPPRHSLALGDTNQGEDGDRRETACPTGPVTASCSPPPTRIPAPSARLPGATLLAADARDALGRHGVELQARISEPSNPDMGAPTTMLFDRHSGRLLSLETPEGETYADEEAYQQGVGTPTMVLRLFLAQGAVDSTTQTIGS